MSLELAFTFDDKTYRHFINGHATVLHCHHYMSLTTQLAMKYANVEGPKILAQCAEDSVLPMLVSYIRDKNIQEPVARLQIGCDYYSAMGLGRMEASGTVAGGEVRLVHSHVDEGWVKKFGPSSEPVNYFTIGYAAAMFSGAFDRPARSYRGQETQSIAKGDSITALVVTAT